jgi:hypothetical protein
MVSTGGTIFATDYNNIRTTVSSVLSSLYGTTLISSSVTGGSTTVVSASQLRNLFLDLQAAYVHQIGSINTTIAVPVTGYSIGADTAFSYNQSTGVYSAVTDGTKMGVNDYIAVASDIANFNPEVSGFPVGNLLPGVATTSTRGTTWGGAGQIQSVYHVVTMTFASATQRNNYFNAGGEVRFTASISGASGAKTTDWAALLSAMGTVRLNKWNVTAASGTSAGLGEQDLTSTYQSLFVKTGSGVYADNDYTIEGRSVSTTQLRFRITFNDGDTGTPGGLPPDFVNDPIDEEVNGTLTSNVQPVRPSSSFVFDAVTYTAVDVAAPTGANQEVLTTNFVSPPA